MHKKTSYLGYALIGLFLLIVGILFIRFNTALKTLIISIGIVLAIFGIIYGIITIAKKDRGARFAVRIGFSIICIVCGVITAIFRNEASKYVAAIFSLLLIVDGSFKLNTSAMAKRYKVEGWWIMLIPAVLLVIGGFTITKFPPSTAETVSVFLGILIIVDSIINLFSIFFVPKFEKNMRFEIISDHESNRIVTDEIDK